MIMYLLSGILPLCLVLIAVLFYCKRRHIIKKVCHMDVCKKFCILQELLEPAGFTYLLPQGVISSSWDAWQRQFGYRQLFDRSAAHFNMVFDCEPIYFDYCGKTWLLELWKGQYGINIGGEIGLYHTDGLVPPSEYDSAHFESADDGEMLPFKMELYHGQRRLFSISHTHWWLTGFSMGKFSEPKDLTMKAVITFPNEEMLRSFTESLKKSGYRDSCFHTCELSATVIFIHPRKKETYGFINRFSRRRSQWENRFLCRLYNLVTRPFTSTLNQLLFLYYLLPSAFRHMIRFRKNRKQKCPKKCRCRRRS